MVVPCFLLSGAVFVLRFYCCAARSVAQVRRWVACVIFRRLLLFGWACPAGTVQVVSHCLSLPVVGRALHFHYRCDALPSALSATCISGLFLLGHSLAFSLLCLCHGLLRLYRCLGIGFGSSFSILPLAFRCLSVIYLLLPRPCHPLRFCCVRLGTALHEGSFAVSAFVCPGTMLAVRV